MLLTSLLSFTVDSKNSRKTSYRVCYQDGKGSRRKSKATVTVVSSLRLDFKQLMERKRGNKFMYLLGICFCVLLYSRFVF